MTDSYDRPPRAQVAFGIDALLMMVVPTFVHFGTFDWDPRGGTPDDAWAPMLVVIILSGLTTGVLFGSLFAYVGPLPAMYTRVRKPCLNTNLHPQPPADLPNLAD
eukprot:SAG31_NODE_544_length_14245_cov_68.376644_7_plen_105_part_00